VSPAEFSCIGEQPLLSSCSVRSACALIWRLKKSDTRPFKAGCRRLGVMAHQPTADGLQNRDIWKSGHRDIGNRSAFGLGLGLGLGLGDAWVALGWPKRGPRATQASRKGRMEEVALFATKGRKRAGPGARRARLSPESPTSREIGASGHRGTDRSGDQGIGRGADPVIKNR